MHLTLRRLSSSVALAATVVACVPVSAQQPYIGPRRVAPSQSQSQPRSTAPPRTAQRAPAPQASAPRGQAPGASVKKQYPVRQAGATEPLPNTAQGGAGQNAQPQRVVGAVAPAAPFTLTPQQQALLDEILKKWEQQSNRIGTFTCSFGRWEVNETFGPAEHQYVLSEAHGEIKYSAPDHGVYQINDQTEWDKSKGVYTKRAEGLDHWVCDGKSIYEYNHEKKELIERQLDPAMQGKAITDGPLPFVFGTKAEQLKNRYWMRDVTPANEVNDKIRLEAWPKFQRDAANFQHAIIILNQRDFMPSALRIVLPDGKNKQDYSFEGTQVNNPLAKLTGAFLAPRTPFGWKKVVIPAGGEQVPPPAGGPAQAQQPREGAQR